MSDQLIRKNRYALFTTMIGLYILCSAGVAAEGKFYITPQLSVTRIDIDEDFLVLGLDEDASLLGANITAGYRAPFNLIIEIGGSYAENPEAFGSTFDNYELSELRAAMGFSIPIGDSFRLVPKAGRYRWRLRTEEGQFANPGSELKTTAENTDDYYQLDAEIMFSRMVGMDFSMLYSDSEFGSVRSFRIGVQIEF